MSKAKELINYFESIGLTVNTNTKARGHHGFCMKNRIDISKNVKDDMIVQTLFHEFAHYIHSKLETNIEKTGGTLTALFETNSLQIFEELLNVTHWIDENSLHKRLSYHKETVKKKIKELDLTIKKDYPEFQRSKNFKDFEKVIKKTKARYLLKYDRIKVCGWFFQKDEIYTIENLEKDFPNLKPACVAYIRLKSYQKKQKRISSRINKLTKYYEKPTELFARFIEGLYYDKIYTQTLAPRTFKTFYELLETGYYKELKAALSLIEN